MSAQNVISIKNKIIIWAIVAIVVAVLAIQVFGSTQQKEEPSDITRDNRSSETKYENDTPEIIPVKNPKLNPEEDRQGGIKPEIFETATFADICFSQGKYEQAGKVYRKLLINEPDNIKYKDRLKIIESKIGLK